MAILLWVAAAIVVANALFAAFLLARFRAEQRRAAEARRLSQTARRRLPPPSIAA